MVLVCMKSVLVLHTSCCLVYICHGVLKVRTGPAAETRNETSRLLQTKHVLTMTEDFEMLLFSTPLRLSLQPHVHRGWYSIVVATVNPVIVWSVVNS